MKRFLSGIASPALAWRWYKAAWRDRPVRFIVASVAMLQFLTILLLLIVPWQYTARAIIAPIVPDQPDLRLLSNRSSEIALGGLYGQKAVPAEYDRFLQTLVSHEFAKRLADRPDFMQTLFSARWDAETGSWREPSGPIATVVLGVAGLFGSKPDPAPSIDDIQQLLTSRIKITAGVMNYSQIIGYSDPDPEKALWLLSTVIVENDALNREKVRDDIARSLAYVAKVLPLTSDNSTRDALIKVLVDLKRLEVAVGASRSFSIDVIDPPYVSTEPTSPRPALQLIAVTALGTFLFGGLVIARFSVRSLAAAGGQMVK